MVALEHWIIINSGLVIVAGDYSAEPTSNNWLRTIGVGDWCYIGDLRQKCHNSKCVIFQQRFLKVLKCYNFLWVQQRHNCSPAVSFANCIMTLYLLRVHLQTFLSIPITQKYQILSCDTLVTNERYVLFLPLSISTSLVTTSWYMCSMFKEPGPDVSTVLRS
jgi:hypothetical protein